MCVGHGAASARLPIALAPEHKVIDGTADEAVERWVEGSRLMRLVRLISPLLCLGVSSARSLFTPLVCNKGEMRRVRRVRRSGRDGRPMCKWG